MNIGHLLEVLLVAFVLLHVLYLFTLHYTALSTLLLNEVENRRILHALVLSDKYMGELAVFTLGHRVNNWVDCNRPIRPDVYFRCGPVMYNEGEGLLVRRKVLYGDRVTVLEVGG